jgi:small GTP-binding protein
MNKIVPAHTRRIHTLAWSPDGKMLASGSKDKTIRLWHGDNFGLVRTLSDHGGWIHSLSWSQDSSTLAAGCGDNKVYLWHKDHETPLKKINGNGGRIWSTSWSSDGEYLAAGCDDHRIRIWNMKTGSASAQTLEAHSKPICDIEWSPDNSLIASASRDGTIRLWELDTGKVRYLLRGHNGSVTTIAWSPSVENIASGGTDQTLRIWDTSTGKLLHIIKGHTETIVDVSFSFDGRFLVSKSRDGEILLRRCEDWKVLARFDGITFSTGGVAFSPNSRVLAACGDDDDPSIHLWQLDLDSLLKSTPVNSVYYTNAKVVFVGKTSTGKTCLIRALMGETFAPQESTHGMRVWPYKAEEDKENDIGLVHRETLLWDLAGQPDYQVIHQLFLDETALGIVVFDSTDSDNPFAGVEHWEQALSRIAKEKCRKLLVAGRVDRGSPTATRDEILEYCKENRFLQFVETSAKSGQGVKELRQLIGESIPWEELPITSSPQLWEDIREYLIDRSSGDQVLTRRADLRSIFSQSRPDLAFSDEAFNTVILHAQTQGLIWTLPFGDFVLLKPEVLNSYASAVIRAARKHPQGLGSVARMRVLDAEIHFEDLERIDESEIERVLLHAVVELFLTRQLAFLEAEQLVFPSKFNRKRPQLDSPEKLHVIYRFTGIVEKTYATLVVKLFYCGAFEIKELWRNAAEFLTPGQHALGFTMDSTEEDRAEIRVFFETDTSIDSRVLFLKYIHEHLLASATEGSVEREREYFCPDCGEGVDSRPAIRRRLEKGLEDIACVYCDARISLNDLIEKKFATKSFSRRVQELERQAAINLDNESKELILVGHTYSIVGEAGHIYRSYANSDHGIDGEIEFKNPDGTASGKRVYLQLKSGDSYLYKRIRDGNEIFTVKKTRHLKYWKSQAYPVFLVIRSSDSVIRWMDVTKYLLQAEKREQEKTARAIRKRKENRVRKRHTGEEKERRVQEDRKRGDSIKQIVFGGKEFNVESVRHICREVIANTKRE